MTVILELQPEQQRRLEAMATQTGQDMTAFLTDLINRLLAEPGAETSAGRGSAALPPNERGLAAMREITERQKNRPFTDGSTTPKLLREARAGAMYGYDAAE